MKRNIIIGLGLFSTIVLASGFYIPYSANTALGQIAPAKTILYLLVGLGAPLALALSIFLLHGYTKSGGNALYQMKGGELALSNTGLQEESGWIASRFNSIAHSLSKDSLHMQWAEQLVVLGEMVGGLAHEIRNPLAAVKASMEVLAQDSSLSAQNRDILLQGTDQIRRIENLLKSVLNFARPPKPQFVRVDVNEVLDSTISLARRHPLFLPERSVLLTSDFEMVPTTLADPLQLQQVFMNLLLNAADAMPKGGVISVRTRSTLPGSIQVTVADTGCGISKTDMTRIFQPFFTTKPNGTGLGLAISKGLIDRHGGSIHVENNKGNSGVSFVITLPVKLEN